MNDDILSAIDAALVGHKDLKVRVGRTTLADKVERLMAGAARGHDCTRPGCECREHHDTETLVYGGRRPVEGIADGVDVTFWVVSELVPGRQAAALPLQRECYTYERIEALHGNPLYMESNTLYSVPQTETETETTEKTDHDRPES